MGEGGEVRVQLMAALVPFTDLRKDCGGLFAGDVRESTGKSRVQFVARLI